MDTNAPLKVRLLRQQPEIELDGKVTEFRGQPLELFIYLADSTAVSHVRSELLAKIYGDNATPKALRQGALFHLPATLKEHYIDSHDPAVIYFHHDNVWVDSQEFAQRANSLLAQAPLGEPHQIEEAQAILDIYQQPFLQGYMPKADGMVQWREDRQIALAQIRNRLLDQVIQYHLWHASLEEAQHYAEAWLDSTEPGYMPLQYLIWIAGNRRQYAQLEFYLDELRKKETKH